MEYQVKVDIITSAGMMHDMVIVKATDELDAEQQAALTVWSLWELQSVKDITIKEVNQMTEGYTPMFRGAPEPAEPTPSETDGYQPYFNQATGRFHDPETNQMVKAPTTESTYTLYEGVNDCGNCDDCDNSDFYSDEVANDTSGYTSYGGTTVKADSEPTIQELADAELGYDISTEALTNLRDDVRAALAAIRDVFDALFDTLADV